MAILGSRCSYRIYDWFFVQSSKGKEWQQEFSDVKDPGAETFKRQLDNVASLARGQLNFLPQARDALIVQELVEEM